MSNRLTLERAVRAAAEMLNNATKPVLVGGLRLRSTGATDAFIDLSNTCNYATAVMPSAKGLVPENLPQFIGIYWGAAGCACCAGIVETADALLFAGPIFDDISTVGDSLLFNKKKAIMAEPDRIVIPGFPSFENVTLKDFLIELTKRVDRNRTSYENFRRIYVPEGSPPQCSSKDDLRVNVLFKYVEKMLGEDMALVVETGDSSFHGQKLKLPQGCRYESQISYASIGWSMNATLGYAQAMPNKRLIACLGDGSFQMSPQDISTMLRLGHNSIIFLINNGGYTTEVEIHDGPYNVIKNWNYTAFVDALDNGEGRCWTAKVRCEEELIAAINTTMGDKRDCLCFIEVIAHRDDVSKELLQFGTRIAAANSRPPHPQLLFLDKKTH